MLVRAHTRLLPFPHVRTLLVRPMVSGLLVLHFGTLAILPLVGSL